METTSLKKIRKNIITSALAVIALFALSAADAFAVPAAPGSEYDGTEKGCRSHVGEMVTLDDVAADIRKKSIKSAKAPQEGQMKSLPLLVVVVGFTDIGYDDGYDWHNTLFTEDDSLSTYYKDMSCDRFTFTPAAESSQYGTDNNTNAADGLNDGIVHISLDAEHERWNLDSDAENLSVIRMLRKAVDKADAYVDFSQYDTDADGTIENNEMALGFVIAGYEGATSDGTKPYDQYLWSHAWSLDAYSSSGLEHDGKQVIDYIAISEKVEDGSIKQAPISLMAHELGHYLGLPDLYDTEQSNSGTWHAYEVGKMSVMANGIWGRDAEGEYSPYSMDIWCRSVLGWTEPVTASEHGEYRIESMDAGEGDNNSSDSASGESDISEAVSVLKIEVDDSGAEYYLLENRQAGKWDPKLISSMTAPSNRGGIVLWHIDEQVYDQYKDENEVNNTGSHRPAVMPLYPEKKNSSGGYTFIGQSPQKNYPFFDLTAWETYFGSDEEESLKLPVYGPDADLSTDGRSLSCIDVRFTSESGSRMTVNIGAHSPAEPVIENEKAADCEHAGSCEEVVYCSGCGVELSRTVRETEQALGHDWGEPQYTWSDDNSSVTASATCEREGCGKTLKETAAVTEEVTKEPTADEEGQITYTAEFRDTTFQTRTKTAAIPKLTDISGMKVVLSKTAYIYNGYVHRPAIVSIGGMALLKGTDYTTVWSAATPKNAGTYTVTIKGKGAYTGTAKASYRINKARNTLAAKGKTIKLKASILKKKSLVRLRRKIMSVSGARGTLTYVKANVSKTRYSKKFVVNKSTGKLTVKKGVRKGLYRVKIKVTAAGNSNYKKLTDIVTVSVRVI